VKRNHRKTCGDGNEEWKGAGNGWSHGESPVHMGLFVWAGIVTNIGTDVQSGAPREGDVYADSMSRPRKRVVFSESDWRP
jgi:hypothetical protein